MPRRPRRPAREEGAETALRLTARLLREPWARADPAFHRDLEEHAARLRGMARARWSRRLEAAYAAIREAAGALPGGAERLSRLWPRDAPFLAAPEGGQALAVVQGADRLFLSLQTLGYAAEGPETRPLLCTGLRALPQRLEWSADPEADGYAALLAVMTRDGVEPHALAPAPAAGGWLSAPWPPGAAVPAGARCAWRVEPRGGAASFAGLFWLVEPAAAARVDAADAEAAGVEPAGAALLLRAEARLAAGLWDEAERLLRAAVETRPAEPESLPPRRALAELYDAAKDRLLEEGTEAAARAAEWLGERGRRQVMLAYCMLLHNYDRFEAGECAQCRECGMV